MKKILMALAATTMLVSFSAPTFAALNPANIYESSHTVNILNEIDREVAKGKTAGVIGLFAWASVDGKVYSLALNELRKQANPGKYFSEYVGAEVRLDIAEEQAEVKAAAKEAIVLIEAGVPADVAVRIVTERIEVPGPVRYVDREITVEVPGPEREVIREVVREVIRDVNTGRTTLDANLVADLNMIDDLTVTAVESTAPLQYGDAPTPNLGDYYTLTVGNDVVHYVYVQDEAAADPIWRAENDPGTNPLGALVAGDGTAAAKFAAENPAPVIGGGEITITGIDVTFTGDDEALTGLAPTKFTWNAAQDAVEAVTGYAGRAALPGYQAGAVFSYTLNGVTYVAAETASGGISSVAVDPNLPQLDTIQEAEDALRDSWGNGVNGVGGRQLDAANGGHDLTDTARIDFGTLSSAPTGSFLTYVERTYDSIAAAHFRAAITEVIGRDAIPASLTVNGAAAYVTENGVIVTERNVPRPQVGQYYEAPNGRFVVYSSAPANGNGWIETGSRGSGDNLGMLAENAHAFYIERQSQINAIYRADFPIVEASTFLGSGGEDFTVGVAITQDHLSEINDAINEAYSTGYEDGFKDGYVVGFADGVESVTGN